MALPEPEPQPLDDPLGDGRFVGVRAAVQVVEHPYAVDELGHRGVEELRDVGGLEPLHPSGQREVGEGAALAGIEPQSRARDLEVDFRHGPLECGVQVRFAMLLPVVLGIDRVGRLGARRLSGQLPRLAPPDVLVAVAAANLGEHRLPLILRQAGDGGELGVADHDVLLEPLLDERLQRSVPAVRVVLAGDRAGPRPRRRPPDVAAPAALGRCLADHRVICAAAASPGRFVRAGTRALPRSSRCRRARSATDAT